MSAISQILISLPYNGCYVFSLSLTLYNFTEIYRFIIYTLLGVLHETSFVCVCVCVWSLCTHVCEFLHPHAKEDVGCPIPSLSALFPWDSLSLKLELGWQPANLPLSHSTELQPHMWSHLAFYMSTKDSNLCSNAWTTHSLTHWAVLPARISF